MRWLENVIVMSMIKAVFTFGYWLKDVIDQLHKRKEK